MNIHKKSSPIQPLFSVIIPSFNRDDSILDAINSVLKQHLTDFEIVVIDDGSTDNTNIILQEYTNKYPNVKYFYQHNQGPSSARNYGANISRGKFLVFLDSDDLVKETWLSSFYKLIYENNNIGLVSIGYENSILYRFPSLFDSYYEDVKALFLAGTFAVEKSIFQSVEGYDKNLTYGENWDLGFRIIGEVFRRELKIFYSNEVGLFYNKDESFENKDYFIKKAQSNVYLSNKYKRILAKGRIAEFLSIAATNYNRAGKYWLSLNNYYKSFVIVPSMKTLFNFVLSAFWVKKKYRRLNNDKGFHKSRNLKHIVIK